MTALSRGCQALYLQYHAMKLHFSSESKREVSTGEIVLSKCSSFDQSPILAPNLP